MSAEPKTMVHQLQGWADKTPNRPAIHGKVDGRWKTLSWAEYWTAARETAKGLIALGHEPGECVALVGANRIEWVVCQLGIMAAKGLPAPGYATNTKEQVAHILRNSEAKIAIADTKQLLDQYRAAMEHDPDNTCVEHLLTMLDGQDDEATSLSALRKLGREQPDDELDRRLDSLTEDDACLLIYTSGTTGVAKGVMLDHGGIGSSVKAILETAAELASAENYTIVSYLPLCHVAEQCMTTFGLLATGGQAYFCPEIAEVKDYLTEVRPTVFAAVPRVWEKFQAALEAKLAQATGVKALLAKLARQIEQRAIEKELATGRPVETFTRSLANKLVISKVKEAIGLDKLILASTAAAPISLGTLEFFASFGIVIHEYYGMSETTGLISGNRLGEARFGTVGPPLPGVEVRIADDGEILARGRNMTRGYLRMPEETAELIDDDGWLHTGDLGSLDDGYLRITGRKKDILITAGGKNVAPAEMEAHISQIRGVGQAVVVGDRQPYLCALITLDTDSLRELAAAADTTEGSVAEMAADSQVQRYFQDEVERTCNAKVARYQTIKKVKVLPHTFSVEGGEVTPTMKVRRAHVTDKYGEAIAAMYA